MNEGVVPLFQPERKQSAAAGALYMQFLGNPTWMTRDYAAFAREGYQENPIVHRSIRLVCEAAKSIPLLVYKNDQPVEKHPFLDLLANPNPEEGTSDFLDGIYTFLMIAGNSYVECVTLGKQPRELWTLRPDRMKIVLGKRGYPEKYIYKVGQHETIYMVPNSGQRPIMHTRMLHPLDDLYGLSPMEPAARAIDTHNSATSYNKALLGNMARPSGALVYKGGDDSQLTPDQYARLRSDLDAKLSGEANAGRPLLLEGGLEWEAMAYSPQDMEFNLGKSTAAREIAMSFGVPPMLLGIPGDNTYSNYKEANLALYRQTVIPFVIKICQRMSVFFRPSYGDDFKVWFDIDQIGGLVQEREDLWKQVDASTTLTVNEKREAIGYEEREEGDVILISTSMVPLDMDTGEEGEEENIDPITGEPIEDSEEPDDSEGGGSGEDERDPAADKDE